MSIVYTAWCCAEKEKAALDSEIQKKTYVASNQRVCGVDAQRINSQLTELKSRLNQSDKELADLDHDLGVEDQLYRQEKMSVSLSAEFLHVICSPRVWNALPAELRHKIHQLRTF